MVLNQRDLRALGAEFENVSWEPYTSNRKLKSKVWRYVVCPYVFGNLVSRRYVKCTLCGEPVYWMGSTSNISGHFKRWHKDVGL